VSARVLNAGTTRLIVDRRRAAERMAEWMGEQLDVLTGDSGVDVHGLRMRAASMLDRIGMLDARLAQQSSEEQRGAAGPTRELEEARQVLRILYWALALSPPGATAATALVRRAIDEQLARVQRARRELDKALR
jgi:hypothetical protein